MNKELKQILSEINRISKSLVIHPTKLTTTQLLGGSELSEWTIRKYGGLKAIVKANFPVSDKKLVDIQNQKEVSTYINKLERDLGKRHSFEARVEKEMITAIKSLPKNALKFPVPTVSKTKKHDCDMTIEFMLSDIHYGKFTGGENPFNLSICRERVRHAVSVLLREIEQHKMIFNVHRLIIAVIGDVIESYTMHGLESAVGCEFNNPKQIDEAVESLWYDVISPLAKTGLKIDFVGVSGNHDRTEQKKTMNKPGENLVTWIIYKGLQRLANTAGIKNIKFHIPEESFTTLNIYGNICLYEHTDNVASPERRPFETLMQKRSKQIGKQIDFLRGGHWHEYMCFDRGRIIINESVAGQDGYSETMGFNSSAGQTINFYIKTNKRPTCFYKSFPVYLNHIK